MRKERKMAKFKNRESIRNLADPALADDELVTADECANYTRLSKWTWLRYASTGRVPPKATPDGFLPMWRVGDVRKFFTPKAGQEKANGVNSGDE